MSMDGIESTALSILRGIGSIDERERQRQFDRFCRQYTQPLVNFLCRCHAAKEEDACDLIHDFWISKLFHPTKDHNLVSQFLTKKAAYPDLSFRHYLCRSLKNYLIDRSRGKDDRNSFIGIEELSGWEPDAELTDDGFDLAWANGLLQSVLETVKAECDAKNQSRLWSVFETMVLVPQLAGRRPLLLSDIAADKGFETSKSASNAIQTVIRKLRRTLKEQIEGYLPVVEGGRSEQEIEIEAKAVFAILARPGGVVISNASFLAGSIAAQESIVIGSTNLFLFDNPLVKSNEDLRLLWLGILDCSINDWLVESGMSLRQHWQLGRFSDLLDVVQPDVELLKAIRDTAKMLGSRQHEALSASVYPFQIHALLYLLAIAIGRLRLRQQLTSLSDEDLTLRVQKMLSYPWLDQRTAELFDDFQSTLKPKH